MISFSKTAKSIHFKKSLGQEKSILKFNSLSSINLFKFAIGWMPVFILQCLENIRNSVSDNPTFKVSWESMPCTLLESHNSGTLLVFLLTGSHHPPKRPSYGLASYTPVIISKNCKWTVWFNRNAFQFFLWTQKSVLFK